MDYNQTSKTQMVALNDEHNFDTIDPGTTASASDTGGAELGVRSIQLNSLFRYDRELHHANSGNRDSLSTGLRIDIDSRRGTRLRSEESRR